MLNSLKKHMKNKLVEIVHKNYKERHNEEPLLVFSPGRINIIGEHTDYNDGFVLPAAVNKGIIAAIGRSYSGSSSAIALDLDSNIIFNLDQV